MDCRLPGSFVHGDFPGRNTGVGCHALLQGIFPTPGSNPGFLHCRQVLYHLSHQGSPVTFKGLTNVNTGGFLDGTSGKKKTYLANAGNAGWIPGLGRSPGEGHGNPLQYSCLETPMDRGAWWATLHRVTKSRTRLEQLSAT